MTSFDWNTALAEHCTHLAGLGKLPPREIECSPLQAISVLCLLAGTPIDHALTPDSTRPVLTVSRYTGRHDLADHLLAELTEAIAAPAYGSFFKGFSPTSWLDEQGFDDLIVRSVQHTADDSGRAALLEHVARRVVDLSKQQDRLRNLHMQHLLRRDIPQLQGPWQSLSSDIIGWVLAHQHDGHPTRQVRIERRFQALRLYGSLSARLREPDITGVIDTGQQLVPALSKKLALTRAQLSALREATLPEDDFASYHRSKFEQAVRHLQAHAIPLHQWPGRGRPGEHAAWKSSPWLKTDNITLVPADYYGTDPTTVRDAVRAFSEDLLEPLLGKLRLLPIASILLAYLAELEPGHLPPTQLFLASIRRALIGPRGPKAFHEAAHAWHRRADAVAALRDENQSDRPGWPPLCPHWTSPCGRYRIVPLTTAKELVAEGNVHHHCVGTYYECCRSGATQILSLRQDGKPAVTAEIILDAQITSLRVAQFKGLHDEVPDDPDLHQAMRNFLRDLRSGIHPLNRAPLRAYRKWASNHYHYGYSSRPLSIAHARQAFPLYLALLPRGTPGEFDRWCDQTGLRKGLIQALRNVSQGADKAA